MKIGIYLNRGIAYEGPMPPAVAFGRTLTEIVNNGGHVLTLWTNQYKIVLYTNESGGYKFCAAPKLGLRAAPKKQSQYGG